MKKLALTMFALCAMALVSSCNSDDEVVTDFDPQTVISDSLKSSDFESLKVQFATFNSDYFSAYYANGSTSMLATKGYGVQTRGWFSRLFKKFLAIITCDWAGAKVGLGLSGGNVAGGIVGAIVGSGIGVVGDAQMQNGAQMPKRSVLKRMGGADSLFLAGYVNTPDVAFNNLTFIEKENNATLVDSVGYYHNKILYDYCMNVNKQDFLLSADKSDFVVSVMEDLEDSLNCDFGTTVQKEEFAKAILSEAQKVSDLLQASTSFDDFISKLSTIYPEYAAELSVFAEYVNGIGMLEIEEDDGEYAKQLLKIVDASSLTNEQKEQMRISIDVGHASSHLWNESAFVAREENTTTVTGTSAQSATGTVVKH